MGKELAFVDSTGHGTGLKLVKRINTGIKSFSGTVQFSSSPTAISGNTTINLDISPIYSITINSFEATISYASGVGTLGNIIFYFTAHNPGNGNGIMFNASISPPQSKTQSGTSFIYKSTNPATYTPQSTSISNWPSKTTCRVSASVPYNSGTIFSSCRSSGSFNFTITYYEYVIDM